MSIFSTVTGKASIGIIAALAIALGVQSWRVGHWQGIADHRRQVIAAREATIADVAGAVRLAYGWQADVRIPDVELPFHVVTLGTTIANVRRTSAEQIATATSNAARVQARYVTIERTANAQMDDLRRDYRGRIADRLRAAGTATRADSGGGAGSYRAASPDCAGAAGEGSRCALVSERDLAITADNLAQLTALITWAKGVAAVDTAPPVTTP